ncbi:hypothetical protein [Lentzea aerocolonigenes]|uniref:hypothetical protein n=1 Tax=Lentzea aerocolonigenes TaxID=68170 RepID=UPI0004C46A84|nr:hypothetical protein [Lentzea aerocolonigenes]MCP2245135.1 hypothetical protein [Lentzea aerocolonigenes]
MLADVDPSEDPVLARALVGTIRDDWRPAADAMASAREWERRAYVTLTLATAAARRGTWLQKWLEARPGDRDAAAVHAAVETLQAS